MRIGLAPPSVPIGNIFSSNGIISLIVLARVARSDFCSAEKAGSEVFRESYTTQIAMARDNTIEIVFASRYRLMIVQ